MVLTEHVDFTPSRAGSSTESYPEVAGFVTDGVLSAPELDVDGCLERVQRCRSRFPQLRVVTGVEVAQLHRHTGQVRDLLARAPFERVLGSVHCLPDGPPGGELAASVGFVPDAQPAAPWCLAG
ncbi:hypothetical protein [Kineococcus indalonis]|uniref:hypothetical protein n=1 Tax=Kineococcus indalonis TaxID=2696566 RepID=UPI001411EE85|nr:hypothetical protein [Kineococcus indalonis]NAZ84991.1 hypothetical protein [Kineococcus indalonis]